MTKKRIILVKIVCRRCGEVIGPIPLDGKLYCCSKCGWLILSHDDPQTVAQRKERGI